jgi:hypothetical protein
MSNLAPSLMSEIQSRFKAAPFVNPGLTITIGGAGGIGSHLSYTLCRQDYTTYIYDFDNIETLNVGSQMYGIQDVGTNKAEVAKSIASHYGNNRYVLGGKFTEESPITNIVFSCFDNMSARKLMFEKWLDLQLNKDAEYRKNNPNEVNIFVDGRMTAGTIQIFFVKSLQEAEMYKKTLFADGSIDPLPCNFKATCQTGMLIGSLMSIGFLNHVANKNQGISMFEVPFYVEYENSLMLYTSKSYKEYVPTY